MKRFLLPPLVAVLTTLAAGPASAATGVLAEARPWHYWIAFAFIAGAAFVLLVALPIGYYLRVWRLRQRGR